MPVVALILQIISVIKMLIFVFQQIQEVVGLIQSHRSTAPGQPMNKLPVQIPMAQPIPPQNSPETSPLSPAYGKNASGNDGAR
jgi:hypothetical protein